MIGHVVLVRWRRGVSAEDKVAWHDAITSMAGEIPEIVHQRAGDDLALAPGGWDYALYVEVADEAALTRYLEHPAHVLFVETHSARLVEELAVAQIVAT